MWLKVLILCHGMVVVSPRTHLNYQGGFNIKGGLFGGPGNLRTFLIQDFGY